MTSITPEKGRAGLLQYSDGTSPITYSTITGVRATQIKTNAGLVDITNKSSAGRQELLPDGGTSSYEMTLDGVFDGAGANLKKLERAAAPETAGYLQLRLIFGDGEEYKGQWAVADFTRNAPHDNAETWACTIRSHGAITHGP